MVNVAATPNAKRFDLGLGEILLALILVIAISYIIIGTILPEIPYRYEGKLLYPLLILFKSSFLLHLCIFAMVLVSVLLTLKKTARNSRTKMAMSIGLIACCCVIAVMNVNIFAPVYRHHDSVRFGETVYQLGSSTGPDPHILQYLVYRCDGYGLVCELISIPHSGIDRSDLPNGSELDQTARFFVSEDDLLNIVVGAETYRIEINP
jgi:hypothetical protein